MIRIGIRRRTNPVTGNEDPAWYKVQENHHAPTNCSSGWKISEQETTALINQATNCAYPNIQSIIAASQIPAVASVSGAVDPDTYGVLTTQNARRLRRDDLEEKQTEIQDFVMYETVNGFDAAEKKAIVDRTKKTWNGADDEYAEITGDLAVDGMMKWFHDTAAASEINGGPKETAFILRGFIQVTHEPLQNRFHAGVLMTTFNVTTLKVEEVYYYEPQTCHTFNGDFHLPWLVSDMVERMDVFKINVVCGAQTTLPLCAMFSTAFILRATLETLPATTTHRTFVSPMDVCFKYQQEPWP